VGIALPAGLQDKEQQIAILIGFFILVTFVIPGFFYS
jgi:ABC-type transport system involved in cytochrome c biogenesis permease subunit